MAPRNLNAYGWKGNVLNRLKRYEEAVANYDQAIKVFATGKIGNKDYADLYMSKVLTSQTWENMRSIASL